MLKQLLSWHRTLALLTVLPFILWALSGLLHPIMSHFSKAPRLDSQPFLVDHEALSGATPLVYVLNKAGIEHFSHASLVTYKQQYFYQIAYMHDERREIVYFSAHDDTKEHVLSDLQYAQYLAQSWSKQRITKIEKLTEFTSGYGDINRILPVYQVTLSNGNHLYIDTLGQRIAAHNTPLRETLSYWFRTLHTFSFMGDKHDYLRIIPMLVVSVLILFMGICGLIVYSILWKRIRKKTWQTAKLHRVTGLSLSVCMLGFASSSTHTLIDKFFPQTFRSLEPSNVLLASQLNHNPIDSLIASQGQGFSLVAVNGQIYSQIKRRQEGVESYEYWQRLKMPSQDVRLAKRILKSQLNVEGELIYNKKVDRFGPTYAFINKRLPVIQLRYQSYPEVLYSVEVSSGYIAAIDNNWQKARAWHFGNLHKYHFLNPLTKEIRDGVMVIIVLSLVFSAAMGLSLYFVRRKKQKYAFSRRLTTIKN